MKDTTTGMTDTAFNKTPSELKSSLNNIDKYGFSKEDQLKMANEYRNKPLSVGDKWYLINADWFNKWAKYIGLDSKGSLTIPDAIDNKCLFKPESKVLKEGIQEEIDYYTIPEELWDYLVKIYSIAQPEDAIERYVIDDAVDESDKGIQLKIELVRMNVTLKCSNWKPNKMHVEEMSRQTTLEQVAQKMREIFDIPKERGVRLFYRSVDEKNTTPIDLSKNLTLNSSGYGVNDIILADVQDENGGWNDELSKKTNDTNAIGAPPPPPPLTTTTFSTQTRQSLRNNSDYSTPYSNRHHDYKPGLCGLSNLGNTCFMNSGIQCMSNVPLLTDYFKEGRYKGDINLVNPLGRKGEIAEAYADLINEMWSGNNSYTIPRNFKLNLSRFAPQFTGYQQQDSQELLAFLLDGLHEDLNRIEKKPYVEMGTHVGKTDEQFAEESWLDHKKRNDSIIVDIFHGLLKSTLNCLVCNEISIKFDPFCYLSVPLPSKKERLVEVFFVPIDSTLPLTKYKLSVLKNGTIQDLCASLEAINPSVQKSRLVVCDVYSAKFFKVFESNEPVSSIKERDDIYVYELAANLSSSDYYKVKLHFKEKGTYMYSSTFFGLPLFFLVQKQNLTHGQLFQTAFQFIRRFLKDSQNANEEIYSKLNNSLNVKDEDNDKIRIDDENSNSRKMIDDDNDADANNPENENNDDDDEVAVKRSSQRLKNKTAQQNKLFNLFLSKNDNIDSDNNLIEIVNDDAEKFEYPAQNSNNYGRDFSSSYSNYQSPSNQVISLIADFSSTSTKRYFNKKYTEEFTEHPSCSSQLVKKKDVISLSDCFNLYTKTEDLSEHDYWYCSKCKNHQPSTKKFDLWSLPQVLVVHLKRFSYSRLYRDKIDTLVEFPLTDLDMSSYLINKKAGEKASTKYNLIAVSNHYGSLGGGHYTAYGQNRCDGKWYYFDDSSVSGSDEASVCTPAAYLLVYLRKDLHESLIADNTKNNLKNSSFNSQSERMDY